jgi:hypothetical protein
MGQKRKKSQHNPSESRAAGRPAGAKHQVDAKNTIPEGSQHHTGNKQKNVRKNVNIYDLIIELSLFFLLSLSLLSEQALSTGDRSLLAGSVILLAAIWLTKRLGIIDSAIGKLGLTFLIMLSIFISKDQSYSLELSSQASILIPFPSLILLIATLSWTFKILQHKEKPNPHRTVIIPFLLCAIFLIVITALLYIPINSVYNLEFKTVKEILFPLITFVLLLSIISLNIVREAQIKRLTLYILVVFAGLLLKNAL